MLLNVHDGHDHWRLSQLDAQLLHDRPETCQKLSKAAGLLPVGESRAAGATQPEHTVTPLLPPFAGLAPTIRRSETLGFQPHPEAYVATILKWRISPGKTPRLKLYDLSAEGERVGGVWEVPPSLPTGRTASGLWSSDIIGGYAEGLGGDTEEGPIGGMPQNAVRTVMHIQRET